MRAPEPKPTAEAACPARAAASAANTPVCGRRNATQDDADRLRVATRLARHHHPTMQLWCPRGFNLRHLLTDGVGHLLLRCGIRWRWSFQTAARCLAPDIIISWLPRANSTCGLEFWYHKLTRTAQGIAGGTVRLRQGHCTSFTWAGSTWAAQGHGRATLVGHRRSTSDPAESIKLMTGNDC